MSNTVENLKAAFAGESQANRKYLAFAKQAEKDGYPQIAKLFRAVAAAETVHAHNHFRIMGGVGSTEENLKAGIAGESYEITSMFPEFIAEAEAAAGRKRLSTPSNGPGKWRRSTSKSSSKCSRTWALILAVWISGFPRFAAAPTLVSGPKSARIVVRRVSASTEGRKSLGLIPIER